MEQAHDLAESEMETQLQTEINALLNPTTKQQPGTTPAVPVANTNQIPASPAASVSLATSKAQQT